MRELMTKKNLLHRSFGEEKGYNVLYHKIELFLSGIIYFREIWPEIVQKR